MEHLIRRDISRDNSTRFAVAMTSLMFGVSVGLLAPIFIPSVKSNHDDMEAWANIPREILVEGEGWRASSFVKNVINVYGDSRPLATRGMIDIGLRCQGRILSVVQEGPSNIRMVLSDDNCLRKE